MRRFHVFALLGLLLPAAASAAPEGGQVKIGEAPPGFTAASADGTTVNLADYKGKIVVLEWHNPGCPFVRKHYEGGHMQKLQADAVGKGVVWLAINSGAAGREGHMNAAQAKEYAAGKKLAAAHYLLDPEGKIGRQYGAKTTPHMFVIDAGGKLAYRGAIDDQPSADPADLAKARNYVRAALDSLMAGKKVETASTQAYGCPVKYGD